LTIGSSAAKLPLPFGSDNSGVVVAIAPAIANGDDEVGWEGDVIGVIELAAASAVDDDAVNGSFNGSFSIFVFDDIASVLHNRKSNTHNAVMLER